MKFWNYTKAKLLTPLTLENTSNEGKYSSEKTTKETKNTLENNKNFYCKQLPILQSMLDKLVVCKNCYNELSAFKCPKKNCTHSIEFGILCVKTISVHLSRFLQGQWRPKHRSFFEKNLLLCWRNIPLDGVTENWLKTAGENPSLKCSYVILGKFEIISSVESLWCKS